MNQGNPSGLYKRIATLGDAIAFLVAIFATPLIFDWTKGAALRYLSNSWGHDFAEALVLFLGLVEGYVIYAAVSFALSAALVWAMTALAARSFRE